MNFADGVGAFAIMAPEEPVTIGDNVELICAASIYNYTDEITWEKNVGGKDERIEDMGNYLKRFELRKGESRRFGCA